MNKYFLIQLCIIIPFFLFSYFCFSDNLTPPEDYLNKKILSNENINLSVGTSVLRPPSSFKNSFGQNFIFQIGYRRENINKYTPPAFAKVRWVTHTSKTLRSFSLFSGIRLPNTHRKTPIYFSLSLGGEFSIDTRKKINFYLQISSIFRIIQFTKNISTVVEINTNYQLNKNKRWISPSSVNLLTGIDINI